MMLDRVRAALALVVWLAATPALATQEPPRVVLKPPEPDPAPAVESTPLAPLTVQAQLSPAELKKAAYAFVQAHAAPTIKIDHVARWRDPLCIQVSGVTTPEGDRIRSRVEQLARTVGRSVARPGCDVNVDIKVSPEPQAVLDRVAVRQESALGYYHRSNAKALSRVTRPIQAWYMTASVGGRAPNAGALFANVGASRPGSEGIDDPDGPTPNGCGDSRIGGSCLSSVFANVLIVVDRDRVSSRSLDVVSDYVAMMALSQARSLDDCGALPSVMDAFASCGARRPSEGLTQADIAYLVALYASDPEASRSSAQADIASRMRRSLASAESASKLKIADAPPAGANQR